MDSFDVQSQAKIFTEITTKGEELFPNHKVFLMYRFAQSGTVKGFDLLDMRPGTPDYKAYETCLRLISPSFGNTTTNPFRRKVPPIHGRQGVPRVASLDFLFEKVRALYLPGKPFDGMLPHDVAAVLVAFGQAILMTWDRASPNGRYYWYPPKTTISGISERSGLISTPMAGENSTWLRVLFSLLEDIILATKAKPPNRAQLISAMTPISSCDFEGAGWDQIPGQEAREDFIVTILRDRITNPTSGHVAIEMAANGIGDINDYVARPPLLEDLILKNPGPPGKAGAPTFVSGTALEVKVPFNIIGDIRILYIQGNQIVHEDNFGRPARGAPITVPLTPGTHFRLVSGETLTVSVSCRNPVGSVMKSTTIQL